MLRALGFFVLRQRETSAAPAYSKNASVFHFAQDFASRRRSASRLRSRSEALFRAFTTPGIFLLDSIADCSGVFPRLFLAVTSAPAFKRAVTTAGFWVLDTALCRGVSPSLSLTFASAPAFSNAVTTAGFLLYAAASCRGVSPSLSLAFASAPAFSNAVTTAGIGVLDNCPVQGHFSVFIPHVHLCPGFEESRNDLGFFVP